MAAFQYRASADRERTNKSTEQTVHATTPVQEFPPFRRGQWFESARVDQLRYFSSVQPLPGENLPVNLTQIAHDLDAKLLEFTLMAKARERVSEEAHSAAEAEKSAWKEGETKRLEDEVRSLLLYTPIMLRDVRLSRLSVSPCCSHCLAFSSCGR